MLILLIVFGPVVMGFVSYILGRRNERLRDWFVVFAAAAEMVLTIMLFRTGPSFFAGGILTGGLGFTTDGFRSVYALITAFMWTLTSLFAREYFEEEREGLNRYWFFILVTLGATEGVMLSADLMTSFVFFEILSFTSFTWVIHEETKDAVKAGYTYLFIAVIGGLVLFMGLLLMQEGAGTLVYSELKQIAENTPDRTGAVQSGLMLSGGICILLGFGAKAGMVPVHVWLPKAHPVAPSPASALLSGILTKVGIYGILMTAANALPADERFGLLILLLGGVTMALGAVLALFSVNLKRTLACSSMSQIGFILTGTGMMVLLEAAGSEEGVILAVSGLMLHMVNHSLIKLTLFMAAGVVVMNLHALDLNTIRGFGRNKVLFKISFALGALGISGVPFFNGYISKTMLHESIVEGIHECGAFSGMLSVMEWVFLISGGFTFAYMLKIFICVFVEKNADPALQKRYDAQSGCMNRFSAAAVYGSSLLMPVLGQPFVMTHLAEHMTGKEEILEFHAFSLENLKGGFTSLAIGAFIYLVLVRKVLYRKKEGYVDLWPSALDLEDRVYRPVLTRLLPGICGNIVRIFGENRILTPLCRAGLFAAGRAAAVPGENKILKPVCRAAFLIAGIFGRIFDMATDSLIVFLRSTVVKEKKVQGISRSHPGLLRTIGTELSGAMRPITSNFTFALMMTCIGILIIFCALIFALI